MSEYNFQLVTARSIPLTQGRVSIVNDEDYDFINQWNWFFNASRGGDGYAMRRETRNGVITNIFMHREINRTPDGYETDHLDGFKLNNTRLNLRTVSKSQNNMNRTSYKGSSSRYKGVCWHKAANKWAARIINDKVSMHLGLFIVEEDAARAYNAAALKLFGEFAKINRIGEYYV